MTRMHVVRGLRAGPEDELAVLVLRRHSRVLLDGQVRVALVEERVLEDVVRGGERRLDISEAQRHELVDIAGVAVLVDPRRVVGEAVVGVAERAQRLTLDVDQIQRLERGELVARDHGRDRIADEPYAVDGEGVFVLADRQNAVWDGDVLAGEHEVNTRMRERARGVDANEARVRKRGPQQLAVHHSRQHDIVRKASLSGDLRAPVYPSPWNADDVHSRLRESVVAIAASTASKIC